ncbi:PorP/SprF family type IX secretion system membrane protein [Galbibacter sp.]|uniref:PorP/SprF family type IX secretion system membrane protein n=1 Tax=Galbibacter sp. TaxID=2918471 RepID=UPI003A8FDA51
MKRYLLNVAMLLVCYTAISQIENKSTIVDWRQHNLTQYNKFLVNPTYSAVRNKQRAVSFWSRIQWTGVDNSPQTYMLSYAGKVGENSGAGLGLYQQSLGLLVDSGLLVNYAYNVQLAEEISFAFGVNTTLFRRGLDKNTANAVDPDPAVLDNKDDFLLVFMPGLNLSIKNFDIGFYAENLFDYNFNDSNTLTDFSKKIFSGQLGYTKELEYANGMFLDARWRTMVYGKSLPNEDFQYGLNTMIDLPYTGWMQIGYNNAFGISGGIGVKVGEGISIGIVYENGTSKTNKAFGSTYEAIATIELGARERRKNIIDIDGKATVSRNVDQANFVTSNDISRSRLDSTDEPDEQQVAAAPHEEEVDQTDKYAVYASESETKDSAGVQTVPAEDSNADVDVAEDQTNSYAQYGGDDALESKPNQGVEKQNPDLKVGDMQLAIVENATTRDNSNSDEAGDDKPQEISAEEMAEIEAAYQEFLEKSDAIASGYSPRVIDSTAVTAEIFGTESSYKTLKAVHGVEKGFYLVLNVFSVKHYFEEFMEILKVRGFEPKFFINPENDYYYVYLYKADRYIIIKNLQRNNINNTYFEDKWVLWVK